VARPRFRWQGFERAPEGALLEQRIDLRSAMGIAYERSVDFHKRWHTHDRHMLVCPRGACRMSVGTAGARHTVDATQVLWVPRGLGHDDRSLSAVYDTLALYPSDAALARSLKEAGLALRAHELEAGCQRWRRTPWLDELLDRYFALRVVSRARRDHRMAAFESQILAEVLRLHGHHGRASATPPPSRDPDDTASVALRYIEANLFSPLGLEEIAARAHTSPASLLRRFRAAFRQTPYAYVRCRRLDEAMHLVRAGEHRLTDVALIVGYEDLAAFSKAFRRRFGKAPSQFAPRSATSRDTSLPSTRRSRASTPARRCPS
jgi:AraC-like DNA-binding protein/uncharacterized protein YjlB